MTSTCERRPTPSQNPLRTPQRPTPSASWPSRGAGRARQVPIDSHGRRRPWHKLRVRGKWPAEVRCGARGLALSRHHADDTKPRAKPVWRSVRPGTRLTTSHGGRPGARSRRSAASTSRAPRRRRGRRVDVEERFAGRRSRRHAEVRAVEDDPEDAAAGAARECAAVRGDEAQADAARERHADGELLGGRVDGGDAVEARGDGPQRVGGGRAEREAVSPPVARDGRLRVSRQQRIRGTRPPVPGSMLDEAGFPLLDPRGRERRLEARRPRQQADQPELRAHRETRRGRGPEKRSAGTSSSLAKLWTRSSMSVVGHAPVVRPSPSRHDASLVTVLTTPSAKTA